MASTVAMDRARRARLVDNATNQCGTLALDQDNATWSGKAPDCESCGQPLGMRSEPLSNWAAFPAGVKFDPSDEELLLHLKAEIGRGNIKSHPFINTFIPVLDGEDGICQTHPENLPGMKKDGSSKHFFHRPAKAYTSGTRKRRKIQSADDEPGVETRWHKTGKTRSVHQNGQVLGWKKIMVLYRNTASEKSKPQKTNWILHQYHLGQTEAEADGELVVCKVFYQNQPRQCLGRRPAEGVAEMETVDVNQGSRDMSGTCLSSVSGGTPVTAKVDTAQRPRSMRPDATGKIGGSSTQSSKGSELTVISMDTKAAVASEYSREWAEEVSTSGKSCQNENDNQVEVERLLMSSEHAVPQFLPSLYGSESQQQYRGEEIISFLFCDEELRVDSFPNMDFNVEFGSLEEPHVSNPNEDYPAIDDILTETLPALNMDYLLSSQEAMDVISLKPGYGFLDNDDSLSST